MGIESELDMSEAVENKERRFGSAAQYYPCFVINLSGNKVPALFTKDQIRIAMRRAKSNPEDAPAAKGWFASLFS